MVCYCVFIERFHCLAVWTEEDFHFVVFGSPSAQSSRFVLVRLAHNSTVVVFSPLLHFLRIFLKQIRGRF